MPGTDLTYTVKIDSSQAASQAAQLRAMFQEQLANIQFSLLDPGALNNALSSTEAIRAQYQQIAADAAQATQSLTQAGSGSATQTREAYDAIARDAQTAAESMRQAASERPQAPIGGGQTGGDGILGGIGNSIAGGFAAYLSVQGAQQILQQAEAFAELGTQVRRTELGFTVLSGGAQQAEARLNAIKEASGGAITNLRAMEVGEQAAGLGLANTTQQLTNLTQAGREISLISPKIHDIGDAIQFLDQASAGLRYRSLIQLGLTADEVKAKMKSLQDANAGMTDQQAFLASSIDLLNTKYGGLLQSTDAQASGFEKLKTAIADAYEELAKGPGSKAIDTGAGIASGVIQSARVAAGSTDVEAEKQSLDELIALRKQAANELANIPLLGPHLAEGVSNLETLKQTFTTLNSLIAAGVPGLEDYQKQVQAAIQTSIQGFNVPTEQIANLKSIGDAYDAAAKAADFYGMNTRKAALATQEAADKAKQGRVDNLLAPIEKLGNNLKDIGLDNFFVSLQDGLMKSGELTANETNKVAELRAQLVSIGQAVAENNGVISASDRQRVAAINEQIDALTEANKLNQELKKTRNDVEGQDLKGVYAELNNIIAQTRNEMNGAGDAAKRLGDAIANSGHVSADQFKEIADLAAQANSADLSKVAQGLKELDQGSLDAVPGVSGLRDEFSKFYDILAAGQGLTDAQAATLDGLKAQADALGGSTSALAGIQEQLGQKFLSTHGYAADLVDKIAELEMLYSGGKIGADQFAGGMDTLTGALYATLLQAGELTPKLRELLNLLAAIRSGGGAGGVLQGPTPGGPSLGGGGYLSPWGSAGGTESSGYKSGQAEADAAIAAARSKADTTARADAIKANEKAAKGAQSAFEHAATETEKAFQKVTDNLVKSLEKVEGLFSPSKVTAEDMALSKAGLYTPKADELLRQVQSAADNDKDKNRFATQIAEAREALSKIGVAPAENLKALAAQLTEAWSSSALFANKDNLKLINADAVKASINLQANAEQGRKNILEYFGATIDAVKEKFKAGDPTIVGAVSAELSDSTDKNIRAMGAQLKAGGQKIIDKVLAMAQASIDKTVGSIGSGTSAGGTGGVAGITVPTVTVGAPTGAAGGFLAGTPFAPGGAGGVVPVTAQITSILPPTAALAPLSISAQITSVLPPATAPAAIPVSAQLSVPQATVDGLLTGLKAPSLLISVVHVASSAGQDILTDIGNSLSTKVADFKSQGTTIRQAIEGGFKASGQNSTLADLIFHEIGGGLQARKEAFTTDGDTARKAIETGFLGAAKTNVLGDAAWHMIGDGMGAHVADFKSDGDTARKAIETGFKGDAKTNTLGDAVFHMIGDGLQAHYAAFVADGKTVVDAIKTGMSTVTADKSGALTSSLTTIAENYAEDLGNQFTASTPAFTGIGTSINTLIGRGLSTPAGATAGKGATNPADGYIAALKKQFDAADFSPVSDTLADKMNKLFSPKKSEVSPGVTAETSSFDFTKMVTGITKGLSGAFGTQTPVFSGMGDTISTFIGNGITDHDFSGAATTITSNISAGFQVEAAKNQMMAAGATLSGAIFAGFQSSLVYAPWIQSIVAAVVAQAASSLNTSLQDSLKTQAVGL